jgi:hypothetical protein
VRLVGGQQFAGGDHAGVAERRAQVVGGLPGEGLRVLLAARGLDEANRGRGGQAAQRVRLAGGALVHGDQSGLRARLAGQLGGQAGEPRIQEPVAPGGADFGGMCERGGDVVTMGGEIDAVEPGGAGEPAVKERGGVGDAGQRAAGGRRQPCTGPQNVRQDRAHHAERHRRLQRTRCRLRADGLAEPAEHLPE